MIAGLLANNAFFEALQNAVTQGPSRDEVIGFWAGAAGLAIMIGLGIRYATRRDSAPERPRRDYLTLAVDLLALTEEDRRELLRIAATTRMPEPASMLLSPVNLARAAHAATQKDGMVDRQPRVESLCQRLFGVPCPKVDSPPQEHDPAGGNAPVSRAR